MLAVFRPGSRKASSLIAGAALATLLGCDLPRRARPPEIDAPPLPAGVIEVVDPPPSAKPFQPSRPPPPEVIEATEQQLLDEGLERIDLAAARSSGEMTVETNDPAVTSKVDRIFDGDPETLVRGDGVNPLQLKLLFAAPVRVKLARVVLAGSLYDWLLEPVAGDAQHQLSNVPQRTWSQIRLDQQVDTQQILFEMRRLERDDFVHINEVELWVEAKAAKP